MSLIGAVYICPQIFDPSLKKKKKKKKTFDLDAALADGSPADGPERSETAATDKENQEPAQNDVDGDPDGKCVKSSGYYLYELDLSCRICEV